MSKRLEAIEAVKLIETRRFSDSRGYFSETWNAKRLEADYGISVNFVQDNMSVSSEVGTVRGLHYQTAPFAQAKLVRVSRGRIFDVAVDFRVGSPTYGKWVGEELSVENGRQLYIPAGFLHGFVTLQADTEVNYKCSAFYAPECEGSIRFDDPDLDIEWGISADKAFLSDKDAKAPFLKDAVSPFSYEDFS